MKKVKIAISCILLATFGAYGGYIWRNSSDSSQKEENSTQARRAVIVGKNSSKEKEEGRPGVIKFLKEWKIRVKNGLTLQEIRDEWKKAMEARESAKEYLGDKPSCIYCVYSEWRETTREKPEKGSKSSLPEDEKKGCGH